MILDVRTPAEHDQIHVPGVHLVPLDRLDATELAEVTGFSKETPLYILCHSGGRAKQAAEKLSRAGYQDCVVVEGGTSAWATSGLPVVRGTSKVIALERQVRIAAGAIVLSGVLLSHFVNPAFIWLSGFVGGGLIFAGITDWCGMGILISKMPWNAQTASCSKK
ncbi:MAG: rhodanese-like domain-containing protein [Verrucomicrobia bacterium]|nr:rhodanese-like domain-containing protein [Verrucomicrobiota bacterium]